jgi:hypothetical protein
VRRALYMAVDGKQVIETNPSYLVDTHLPGSPLNTAGVNDPKLTEMLSSNGAPSTRRSAGRSSTTSSGSVPSRRITST